MEADGNWSRWLVNNFYNLDSNSEKGIIAAATPMDKYLMDLNNGQNFYWPSYMLVAVLKTDTTPSQYQAAINRVYNHFYHHDFVYDHALGNILSSLLIIYVALLTIFVGVKEFARWHDMRTGRHPGELFVIGWTILIIGIFLAKVILHKQYVIPGEVVSTYIAVLSIMAITQKSKEMQKESKKSR